MIRLDEDVDSLQKEIDHQCQRMLALQLMNVGSKFRLFIPSKLAYGSRVV